VHHSLSTGLELSSTTPRHTIRHHHTQQRDNALHRQPRSRSRRHFPGSIPYAAEAEQIVARAYLSETPLARHTPTSFRDDTPLPAYGPP
ncbi:hypothetical protein ACWCQD_42420, partial [Streptomyces atratus]